MLEVKLKYTVKDFLNQIKGENLHVISHFDTDGITSAAIMIRALKRLDQTFTLEIVKSLNKKFIDNLPKDKIILFLDLASNNLEDIKYAELKKVYIIDHHEITESIPENVEIVNPHLFEKQKISASGLTYLFCREIDSKNKDLAKLSILGMIGDRMDNEISKLNDEILKDGDIEIKKGLMLYPSTRPLNRVLEYSSDPFIPGVTGDMKGVLEFLRENGLGPIGGKYKNLIDLTEDEMKKLVTGVILRNPEYTEDGLIGNLFLIKLFGKLEDAREMSAKINACSRNGSPSIAIAMCLENMDAKKKAESIHVKHKQTLISSLKYAKEMKKIESEGFVIINAKDKIKDTVIGTVMSITASSREYKDGTVLIGMATDNENESIKISARIVGRKGLHLRELLANIMESFEGEVGGHEFAAGCSIKQVDEVRFIEKICQTFEPKILASWESKL